MLFHKQKRWEKRAALLWGNALPCVDGEMPHVKFKKYKHHNSLTIPSPGNKDEELALRFSCTEIPSEASLKMQQEQFNEIKKAADWWR